MDYQVNTIGKATRPVSQIQSLFTIFTQSLSTMKVLRIRLAMLRTQLYEKIEVDCDQKHMLGAICEFAQFINCAAHFVN